MKVTHILLVASCVLLSSTNHVNLTSAVPDIDTLKGPTTSTPVPANNNGTVTDPASTTFGTGTSSRLALYVPGNVYKDYPGWLPLYKALVFQGIPVTVTKDINVAKSHDTVLAYQAFQSKYLGFFDSLTWSGYVTGGNTLISIGMTSKDLFLRMAFGVGIDTNTANAKYREAIVLQKGQSPNSQFDFTDVRDTEIPLYREVADEGFPSIGYTLDWGTNSLGAYRDDEVK